VFAIVRRVTRRDPAGLSLLDLLVVLALFALLIYVVRLDWQRPLPESPPGAHSATRSSRTSV
jgi:hypothetical protein